MTQRFAPGAGADAAESLGSSEDGIVVDRFNFFSVMGDGQNNNRSSWDRLKFVIDHDPCRDASISKA
ncbi:MAG: hypothetical protein IT448_04940 [Phycisphaerales bacterium]|nr:hypothetical protein [Phycisphaerales bacterium]